MENGDSFANSFLSSKTIDLSCSESASSMVFIVSMVKKWPRKRLLCNLSKVALHVKMIQMMSSKPKCLCYLCYLYVQPSQKRSLQIVRKQQCNSPVGISHKSSSKLNLDESWPCFQIPCITA